MSLRSLALLAVWIVAASAASPEDEERKDPCAAIAGQKWVSPKAVRKCFASFPVDPVIKSNTIDVINKTLAFHTSVNYQISAPEPYKDEVHEDIIGDIARISRQKYENEYELHKDISYSFKRLNDGHSVWINRCYDGAFASYLPIPLVLLDGPDGEHVYIAPEAFAVASAEFADQIDVWQNALPGKLKGQLSSLSGAKVIAINGESPINAANKNAEVTGSFQAFGTRQTAFFASYARAATGWSYVFGNFAQRSLPLYDEVELTVQRVNSTKKETFTLPYRSRIGTTLKNFTDSATYRASNCVAVPGTNGKDLYSNSPERDPSELPITPFRQQPKINPEDARKRALNVMLDTSPLSDVVLPPVLQPANPLGESYSVAQFYLQKDSSGTTGVLALGSFSAADYTTFLKSLLDGLQALKAQGATRLLVDVTNNGGGFICAAEWLHRIIVGPKSTTQPQAGLDTTLRVGPLAQLIAKQAASGLDPENQLLYNPFSWTNASSVQFPEGADWLGDSTLVNLKINGRPDRFSQRLGDECQVTGGFTVAPPSEPLFEAKNVAIITNGRCASSCALFTITMQKEEGVKIAVLGGKKGVEQQYCGTVGGQSTDFATIDTEIKTTHLKNNTLAPPDLLTNSVQGITWRLGYGITDRNQPEEWQDHPADLTFSLTNATVNNPVAIWQSVIQKVFSS